MTPVLTPGLLYYSNNKNVDVLWIFSGSQGQNPVVAPILVGDTLYGVTTEGGTIIGGNTFGTLYSINKNGTNFQVPHSFLGGTSDGTNNVGNPGLFSGYLILSGSTIVGTTYQGGPSTDFAHHDATTDAGGGSIFFYNTSNSNYNVIFPFISSSVYGSFPNSITIYNNKIYGTTFGGGQGWENWSSPDVGTIYSLNTDGTGFSLVYTLESASAGVGSPVGFTQAGNMLYGSYLAGNGGIFSFDMNTDTFTPLYAFTGGTDGSAPYIYPIVSGSKLYGSALQAGASGCGTIYSMNTDGTGFSVVYTFPGVTSAVFPNSNLYFKGNTIYGLSGGGSYGNGTIFSLNKEGTNFKILYNFTGSNDGILGGYNTFTVYDNVIYCTATYGGTWNEGTIFSYYIEQ